MSLLDPTNVVNKLGQGHILWYEDDLYLLIDLAAWPDFYGAAQLGYARVCIFSECNRCTGAVLTFNDAVRTLGIPLRDGKVVGKLIAKEHAEWPLVTSCLDRLMRRFSYSRTALGSLQRFELRASPAGQ